MDKLTQIYEDRNKWLNEHSSNEGNVMEDETGQYIVVESDNGSPSDEGYEVGMKKVYLPDNLTDYEL